MTATAVRWAAALSIAVAAATAPVDAYLKLAVRIGGRDLELRWMDTPVRYAITNRAVGGVSVQEFQAAVDRAFATWQNVPTTGITYQFAGVTSALPGDDDGLTTLGFDAEPSLDRVLAATSFLIDITTGEIVESDIFFNSIFAWSVAPSGVRGRYDVESIALHEIGHLSGLGHSAIGETEMASGGRRVLAAEAVMFPIAFSAGNVTGRALRHDDVAGISDLYPLGDFEDATGSISGRVTKNGTGVRGAHVVAFDVERGTLVGNFTLSSDGRFTIAGLAPGPHALRVEPLDDADVESFFSPPIDINFRPMFAERLVVVPRGGNSDTVEVVVEPR
jgi:hypothetical protein